MTITLPTEAVDILAGRHNAVAISEALILAYWLHGRSDSAALHHLRAAHHEFAVLADAMGYTIASKEAPVAEAAE